MNKSNNDDSENSRMSSGRSSEDREDEESESIAAASAMRSMIYRDLLLLPSTMQQHQEGVDHIEQQKQPMSLQQTSRMGSYGRLERERSVTAAAREELRQVRNSVKGKTIIFYFFSSLIPSRANRFGYPVFPEREFGIPSRSGPVSFAGFAVAAKDPPSLSSIMQTAGGRESILPQVVPRYIGTAADDAKKWNKRSKNRIVSSLRRLF
jgi:hypothetical protein